MEIGGGGEAGKGNSGLIIKQCCRKGKKQQQKQIKIKNAQEQQKVLLLYNLRQSNLVEIGREGGTQEKETQVWLSNNVAEKVNK